MNTTAPPALSLQSSSTTSSTMRRNRCVRCGELAVWKCPSCTGACCGHPHHQQQHQIQCLCTQKMASGLHVPSRCIQAIVFHPNQACGRYCEVNLHVDNHSSVPLLYDYFKGDKIDCIPLRIGIGNTILDQPVELWYSETARADSEPLNRAIKSVKRSCRWFGAVVVLKCAGRTDRAYVDITQDDIPVVDKYFIDYASF